MPKLKEQKEQKPEEKKPEEIETKGPQGLTRKQQNTFRTVLGLERYNVENVHENIDTDEETAILKNRELDKYYDESAVQMRFFFWILTSEVIYQLSKRV